MASRGDGCGAYELCAAMPIPHPAGCLTMTRCLPGMPSLRSCMPGYGVADILADVIFPATICKRVCQNSWHTLLRILSVN